MTNYFIEYLPYLLSAITAYSMLLAGNKSKNARLLGLINQLLWLVRIILSSTWGLLPMNIVLWIIYGRNYFKR